MNERAPSTLRGPGWKIWVALAALFVIPVLYMAASQYLDGRENVVSRCAQMTDPAGVSSSEIPLLSASVTAFPAGRLCLYEAEAGGTIAVQTGWPGTAAGIAGTVLVVALTTVALRRGGGDHPLTALFPATAVIFIWTVVIVSAHTVLN